MVRFVENQNKAVKTIHTNLEQTRLAEWGEVWRKNVFSVLREPADRQFDYVFIAPPQFKDIWSKALLALDQNPSWLLDDSWIIVQIDKLEFKPQPLDNLELFRRESYGSTELVFFKVKDGVA